MPRTLVAVALCALLALAACGGESKEDKALSQVCSARADISKQVDSLQNLQLNAAAISTVQTAVKAIQGDLKTIGSARGDLSDQRKQGIEDATNTFTSEVSSIVSGLAGRGGLSNAATQLQSAVQELAASYKKTLGAVDCSSAN